MTSFIRTGLSSDNASKNPLGNHPQLGLIDTPALSAHEQVGFELGWDYAHYRVGLPAPYATEASPLRDGLRAGEATFGLRTLAATRHVRKWLQLRLHAWLRGRSVELVQVTPNYLQQIDTSHCPITRAPLSTATLESSDASVDRVRNDAGYAAGNLAGLISDLRGQAPAAKHLLLSVHDEPSVVAAAIGAGADGMVLKRAIGSDLIPAIEALLAGQHYFNSSATY